MKQRYFHGKRKQYPYFEGWYLKHQNQGEAVAFIPAIHVDRKGRQTASLQVVLKDGAWNFTYPIQSCKVRRKRFGVKIGENLFTDKGISVNIHTQELSIQGKIMYSDFQRIKGDIMGPFRFCPFMQCNHGILSMSHTLKGSLMINGEKIEFTGGTGYIETDWGDSFPDKYLWTQCNFGVGGKNSIMASVADIPFLGGKFEGCICDIHYGGKEYKMATYYGARIMLCESGKLVLKQGNKTLSVTCLEERPNSLKAPIKGEMGRWIKESLACRVKYQFWIGKRPVFQVISSMASFEQVCNITFLKGMD